eukprot:14812058-Alexandrium_andersonii.AAC.1
MHLLWVGCGAPIRMPEVGGWPSPCALDPPASVSLGGVPRTGNPLPPGLDPRGPGLLLELVGLPPDLSSERERNGSS